MLILSLDTSRRLGSAAVLRDRTVIGEVAGDDSVNHAQRLPGDLMTLLSAAGLRVQDVELFAVAAGPGSFTGLRVGIATMQGLAMAGGRRVAPVSTLDAIARSRAQADHPIAAWIDAQRGEVYASLYGPDGRALLVGPTSATPEATLAAWRGHTDLSGATFIGDGALRYRDAIASAVADARVEPSPPLAGIIGQIAADEPGLAVLPHAVTPIYVRRTDAEITRDRGRPTDGPR